MKKKILILALILSSLAAIFSVVAFATDTPEEPTLTIEAANLSFEDSVYVLYAVSHEGIDAEEIQMLFWTAPQDEYTVGTEAYAKDYFAVDVVVDEKSCTAFKNNELRAKNMADDIYARAYANVDGKEYYSEVSKYSILQYAYNKLGKTGTRSESATLCDMLVKMLPYGAAAQKHFNHNTARPADGDFYQIKVEGGVLEDGFTKGLYLASESATLTAPQTKDGKPFSAWKNSVGEVISTDAVATLSGFTKNETYTATYEEPAPSYSEGLIYTLSDDGTYYIVSGIGTCTDSVLVIPPEYEGLPVKEIGSHAFYDCGDLISVTIPDSVVKICEGAFYECFSLTNVMISESVTDIGDAAFGACTSLLSIAVDDGNTAYKSIDENLYSFDGKILIQYAIGKTDTHFDIPDSVTSIGFLAFAGCTSLANVNLGNFITEIGDFAFTACSNLTSVTIPDSITSISYALFSGCSKLTNVIIPDSITTIGYYAFKSCSSLTSITIPDSVTEIGDRAFYGCDSLTSVTIPDSVTSIGYQAFYYCSSLTSITIPDSVTEIGEGAFYSCTSLTSITVAEGNTTYKSIDGNLYSIDSKTLIQYAIGKTDTHFDIPNSVTEIGDWAFYNCTSLTSINIGNSVTLIGNSAFAYCSGLASVTISDSVTEIGEGAFADCTSLTSVYYKGTKAEWERICIGSYNTSDATRYYYSEEAPTEEGNFWHYVDGEIVVWTKESEV